MQNKSFGENYMIHFRSIFFPFVWPGIGLLFGCLLALFVMIAATYPLERNYESICDSGYSFVLESDVRYDDFPCNYKLDNLVVIGNTDGSKINVNTYMTSSADNSFGKTDLSVQLSEDEVAISQKIAENLNVKIGDAVHLWLPYYEDEKLFTISVITPYVWDFYEVRDNLDFSVSCLAYSEDIENKANGKYVYFLNQSDYELFVSNNYSYSAKYDITNEMEQISIIQITGNTVLAVLIVILSSLSYVLISKMITKECIKYVFNSYSFRFVKRMHRTDHFIFLLVPIIFICCICYAVFRIGFISWIASAGTFVSLILTLVLSEYGGRIYGK